MDSNLRNMPGRRPPCSPSVSGRGSKRRSGLEHQRQGKQGRVSSDRSRVVDAGVLDVNDVVAASPQARQDEAGPDSAGLGCEVGLASAEAVNLARRSGPQQEISRVDANARQPAPRTDFTREFSPEQRSPNLQTVPVVADAKNHDVRMSQLMQFRSTKEEKLASAPPTLHAENPRATKIQHLELPKPVEDSNLSRAKPAAAAENHPVSNHHRGGGKPNSRTLISILRARKNRNRPNAPQAPQNYSSPPPPFDDGHVSHVNICPVCEKYSVTELDRSAAAGTGETTLRARFLCGLCREVLDLGIALFDPRGIPGVTVYEGEDRLRPPVPPRGMYPCPRCWKNTHTSFQCMVAYLREESQVQCEPACPAERLDLSSWEGKPEEKPPEMEARNVIRTVLGLF